MSVLSRRAAWLLVALLGFSNPASAGIFGDVEADCDIDVADAVKLERYLAGLTTLTNEQATNANIAPIGGVRDAVTDIGDLLTLKRVVAGDAPMPVAAFNTPTITTITGTNPVEISGTAQTGVPGLEIVLYVNGRTLPYVSAVNVGTGAFDFGVGAGDEADVPLVDGENRITAIARVGNSHSCSSAPQMRTYHPATQLAGANLNFANDLVNGNPTHAATMVWTPELSNGQAYNVTSTVTILSGQSLFIQPGVQVKFANNAKLIVGVGGRLKILGMAGQMVELAPNGACGPTTRWGGIEVATNVVPPTHIEYARIQCVTTGLRVYDTDASGLVVGPIPGGQAVLNFSEIDGFTQKGVFVEHMSVVSVGISFNKIIGNGTNAVGVEAMDNSTTIRGNTIEARGTNSVGIRTYTTLPQSRSVTAERNVITRSSRAGIEINIADHDPSPSNELQNSTVFSQNTVTQNCRGVMLSTLSEDPQPKFIGNSIFNNNHECGSSQDQRPSKDFTYDDVGGTIAYSCSSTTPAGWIDATGNWWGSTDPAFIANRVDHPPGCPGAIDYTPFLSAPHDQSGYWIGLPHSTLITGSVSDVTTPPAAGPDWVLAGTVTIPPSTTWTIPDGQVLKFARHSKLVVQGALVIQDLNLADVTLTGLVPPGATSEIGDWSGIVIEPSTAAAPAGTATIDDALFRYATQAVSTTTDTTVRAHVNVLDSKFELFSSKGVVLNRVTSTSQVANSVIDGTITATEWLRKDAQQNITGVQITDLTTPTGCAPTCVKVTNSTIQRLVTGIHVRGAAKPEISNNTIKENIWGIWLEGEGTGQPNPVIKNNKIHANSGDTPQQPFQEPLSFRFCTNSGLGAGAGSNLCLSDYTTTGAATLIDAKRNYWGVLTSDGVRASVTTSEGERASVNVSEFLNASNAIVGPADLLSAIFVAINSVGAAGFTGGPVIRPTVVAGEDLDISYRLHRTADVQVEIFNEVDNTTTATPLRTYNVEDQAAGGPYTLSWDGKNSSAQWVSDGAYTFVLTARHPSSGAVLDRYDPPRNHGVFAINNYSILGDRGTGKPQPLPPPPHNSFKNDYLTYDYGLEAHPDHPLPFSSRVTATILKRENTQLCDAQNGQGKVIAKPWVDKPLWVGQYNFVWDGRADSYVDLTAGYAPGELVPGGTAGFPDFCLFFSVPAAMKPNHVIVTRAQPTLTGPGTAPEIEIKSDPYVVRPSYDQSSALTFKVDQSANVMLYILAPGDLNLENALSSIPIDGNDNPADGVQPVPANTLRTYFWKGHPDTPGDSNLLAATFDGAYTFALEATSTQQANLTSLYRGVINVRGEREER